MGHRVSWRWGGPGLGPWPVIDTHAYDVPLSRKVPGLSDARPALAATDPAVQQREAARLSDLLEDMDRARVTTSLVVLPEETGEFFRLAAQHPGRLYGLANYDSLSPRRGLEQLQGLCDGHPALILGVATAFPCFQQDPRLKDFVPLYEYCARRGLPVQFQTGGDPTRGEAARPTAFGVLARTYPPLKVVCRCTGGWPGEMPGLLRRFPNLYLQVEALGAAEAEKKGESRTLQALLRAVGSRKVMFGSGWRGREADYAQRVEAVRRLPWWQRRNVAWRTAAFVYGPRILGKWTMETGNRRD